jgi:hypothetical protein
MSLFTYHGPDATYSYLQVGKDSYAPFTLTDSAVVDLAEAPDDGHFTPGGKKSDAVLADNDPKTIEDGNVAAQAAAAEATSDEEPPPTAGDVSHDQTQPATTSSSSQAGTSASKAGE